VKLRVVTQSWMCKENCLGKYKLHSHLWWCLSLSWALVPEGIMFELSPSPLAPHHRACDLGNIAMSQDYLLSPSWVTQDLCTLTWWDPQAISLPSK